MSTICLLFDFPTFNSNKPPITNTYSSLQSDATPNTQYNTIITTLHQYYYYFYYISIIISVTISCYSSSLPTHIRRVTLYRCPGDFTCRLSCLDAAREVKIDGGYTWQSRDSERLCDVTEHR